MATWKKVVVESSSGNIAQKAATAGTADNITSQGNLAVLNTVDTAQIDGLAVTTAKLATSAVTNAKLANDAVDADKISSNAVITAKIANEAVTAAKIESGCIESQHLEASIINDSQLVSDDIIDSQHYVNGSIDAAHLASNSVTNDKVADNAIGIAELSATGSSITTKFLRGDNTWATVSTANDDVSVPNLKTALNSDFAGDFTIGTQTDDDAIFSGPVKTKELFVNGATGGPARITLQADSGGPENGDKWEIWGSDSNAGLLNFYNNTSGSDTVVFQIQGDGDVVVKKDLQIDGDLTISGNTTTVNTETILLDDNTIVLNNNESGTPSADAGIVVERGTSANKALYWDESGDRWSVGHTEAGTAGATTFSTDANLATVLVPGNTIVPSNTTNSYGVGSFYVLSDGSAYLRTA